MKPPSTEWREEVGGGEAERFAGYAELLTAMQAKKSKKFGNGRALHRRQVLGLRGELLVLPSLPPYASHGLFERSGKHEVRVRLSNGSPDLQADRKPDIRGFAIKVLGVDGPGALGASAAAQDFVLINRETFGFETSREFIGLVTALGRGPLAVVGHMLRSYGLVGGLARLKSLAKSVGRPFSGFASESFFSAAPIACGPYAARVRLSPQNPGESAAAVPKKWDGDLRERLRRGPLRFTLALQFFVEEETTPIENGAIDWPASIAPYLPVGQLVLPQQELDDSLQQEIENATFDPWGALLAHRPLGEIMRARKVAYRASQKARGIA
jgi:catalase